MSFPVATLAMVLALAAGLVAIAVLARSTAQRLLALNERVLSARGGRPPRGDAATDYEERRQTAERYRRASSILIVLAGSALLLDVVLFAAVLYPTWLTWIAAAAVIALAALALAVLRRAAWQVPDTTLED